MHAARSNIELRDAPRDGWKLAPRDEYTCTLNTEGPPEAAHRTIDNRLAEDGQRGAPAGGLGGSAADGGAAKQAASAPGRSIGDPSAWARTGRSTVTRSPPPSRTCPSIPPVARPPVRYRRIKVEVLRKGFGADPAQAVAEITELAAQEGLVLRHDKAIFSNTFQAHRLVALASSQDLGEQMVERLFHAHHTDELNVADFDTLRCLAAEAGVRWSDAGAGRTRADLDRVRRSGIRGVPVLQFADRPATGGALSEQAIPSELAHA